MMMMGGGWKEAKREDEEIQWNGSELQGMERTADGFISPYAMGERKRDVSASPYAGHPSSSFSSSPTKRDAPLPPYTPAASTSGSSWRSASQFPAPGGRKIATFQA